MTSLVQFYPTIVIPVTNEWCILQEYFIIRAEKVQMRHKTLKMVQICHPSSCGPNIPRCYNVGPNMPLFTITWAFSTRKNDQFFPELCEMAYPVGLCPLLENKFLPI